MNTQMYPEETVIERADDQTNHVSEEENTNRKIRIGSQRGDDTL